MADVKIVGRLYNLGNDYPSEVGCRPVSGDWKADSYLDGIYTEAEEGFVSGKWNKYFNTVLPQEDWSDVDASGRIFPDEYAVAYLNLEKDYKQEVASGYASSGIDVIEDTKYEGISAWKGGNSPYRKNFPNI
jgi:hypothetical protein